jgi:hypothetical protein
MSFLSLFEQDFRTMQRKPLTVTKNDIGQVIRTHGTAVGFSGIFSISRSNDFNTTGGSGWAILWIAGQAVLYIELETVINKGDIVQVADIDYKVDDVAVVPCFEWDMDHKKVFLSKIE